MSDNQIVNPVVATATSQPEVKAVRKNKCHLPDCNDRVVKIIGDCKFCQQKFCGRHRTVEAHHCQNIEACRQAHFDKNEKKLISEKTTLAKV
jgi:predicted nucleic acid binding AN1-type Zn finger protein